MIFSQRNGPIQLVKVVPGNVPAQSRVNKQSDRIEATILGFAKITRNQIRIKQVRLPHFPGPVKVTGVVDAKCKKGLALGVDQVPFICCNCYQSHSG